MSARKTARSVAAKKGWARHHRRVAALAEMKAPDVRRATAYEFKTRGGQNARLNSAYPWERGEFAWLGTVELDTGSVIGWAWLLDGRSIDRSDREFDLVDFRFIGPVAHPVYLAPTEADYL